MTEAALQHVFDEVFGREEVTAEPVSDNLTGAHILREWLLPAAQVGAWLASCRGPTPSKQALPYPFSL